MIHPALIHFHKRILSHSGQFICIFRNVSLSLRTYSFVAVAHYAIPFVYIAVLGYCCFPRAQHLYLHDKSVASMLDLNLTTSNVSLNFFVAKNVKNQIWQILIIDI